MHFSYKALGSEYTGCLLAAHGQGSAQKVLICFRGHNIMEVVYMINHYLLALKAGHVHFNIIFGQ